jgi:hypothetical protein
MCFRHAPAPLHIPSLPHIAAGVDVHWPATTGGSPAATGEQVPVLQVVHVPVQAVLQQMPSTQKPDAQSVPTPDGHGPPIGILPQLMAVHVLPDVHSLVAEHVVRQLVPDVAQVYGAHEFVIAGRHIPAPSHVRAADSVDPVQLWAAQLVPAAW